MTQSTIIIIAVVVVVLVVAFFILRKVFKKKVKEAIAPEVAEPKKERPEDFTTTEVEDILTDLNMDLVMSTGASEEVKGVYASLMDALLKTWEKAKEVYPTESFTWELGRIATKHLPEVMQKYIQASPAVKEKQESGIIEGLAGLSKVCEDSEKIIDSHDASGLRSKANFIKMKY